MDYVRVALITVAVLGPPAGSWQAKVADAPELHTGFHLLYELRPVEAHAEFAAALIEKHQLESLSMIGEADTFAKKLLAVDPDAADAYLT